MTLSIVVGLAVAIILVPILFYYFNFPTVALPYSVYVILTEDLTSFMRGIYYFVPLNFLTSCLIAIFIAKHFHIIWNLFNYILDRVMGN